MVSRPSYLYNGKSYTCRTSSYWNGPLVFYVCHRSSPATLYPMKGSITYETPFLIGRDLAIANVHDFSQRRKSYQAWNGTYIGEKVKFMKYLNCQYQCHCATWKRHQMSHIFSNLLFCICTLNSTFSTASIFPIQPNLIYSLSLDTRLRYLICISNGDTMVLC